VYSGINISQTHKSKLIGNEDKQGKFPFRKMDTVLELIDHDRVYEFAKEYQFSV